jgi:hypothetical protein
MVAESLGMWGQLINGLRIATAQSLVKNPKDAKKPYIKGKKRQSKGKRVLRLVKRREYGEATRRDEKAGGQERL